jgi:hypothetical protein
MGKLRDTHPQGNGWLWLKSKREPIFGDRFPLTLNPNL